METERDQTVPKQQRVKLTVQLSLSAYHAILDIQRRHRIQKGSALPIWKVIDSAVRAYAQKHDPKL